MPGYYKVAVTLSAETFSEAQKLLIEATRAGRRVSMSAIVEIAVARFVKLPPNEVATALKGVKARRSPPAKKAR